MYLNSHTLLWPYLWCYWFIFWIHVSFILLQLAALWRRFVTERRWRPRVPITRSSSLIMRATDACALGSVSARSTVTWAAMLTWRTILTISAQGKDNANFRWPTLWTITSTRVQKMWRHTWRHHGIVRQVSFLWFKMGVSFWYFLSLNMVGLTKIEILFTLILGFLSLSRINLWNII